MEVPDNSEHRPGRRRERDRPLDEPLTRELLSHLPGLAYRRRLDVDWTMEYVSAGCRTLTGFGPGDLRDNRVVSYDSLIHSDDRDRVRRAIDDAITGGRAFRVTYRIRRADGHERWVWEQGSAIRGKDGTIEALQGFITDITDRKELAARADGAYRLFHSLTEQSFTGVFVVRDDRITYANPRFIELFDLAEDPLEEELSFIELVRRDDRTRVSGALTALTSGQSDVARFECATSSTEGSARTLQAQLNTVLFDDQPVVLGVLLDITERRRAQRREHEVQKMQSLGQLARGIAHDFNNVLGIVSAAAALLLESSKLDAQAREDVERITEAVDRGTALSRQLMTFGQVGRYGPGRVRVSDVVDRMMPMLERLVAGDIELKTSIEPRLPELALDPSHVEQVIMNLVMNARDAMPEGGTILVGARLEPEGPRSGPPEHRSKPHVVLTVEDEGTGIDPECVPDLFEPYFTTKGDKGTGLGLGNVWRIATDLGGSVEVDSEVGRGSTFSVHLPVLDR